MARNVRNVGPALVAFTMAMITAGALTIAAGSPAPAPANPVTSPASAVTSLGMLNQNIYGTGVGYDVKANLWVGGSQGQKVAIRFKATTTSALKSVRFVQRGGTGYSLGNGGTMTVSVRADDGAGHPAATSLAQQLYSPGNPAGAWETHNPVSFTTPATLTSGKIYYVVFTNTSTTNYISVNSVFSYAPTTPRQPLFADSEYGLMYTTGAWGSVHRSYTPVIDLAYVNGIHDGQSYYEAMIANYATISGTGSMARERFTVAGGNKTVASAAVRVRRSAGTSPLVMTLETSAGVAIESVSVPATSVPVSAPGGANGGAVWVKANFRSPRILANGATYNLRISTAAGTTYTTFPVRQGTSKGFATYAFTSGSGQKTTNGSTWADLYAYDQQDLQFYFTLATPPITPTTTAPAPTTTTTTTTPAPTTTTTTPAPTVTTTTPALASSLQCPVVASPKVGQTVTCTYR